MQFCLSVLSPTSETRVVVRVVHVIHSMDARSGGPAYHIRNLVPRQVSAGHQVAVLATDARKDASMTRQEYGRNILDDRTLSGAEIHLGRAWGKRWPWSTISYSPSCADWLKRRISEPKTRPDIVHIHGIFSHVTHVAAQTAAIRGVRYIVRTTGALDDPCFNMRHRRSKELACRLFLYRQLKMAAAVDTTSELEAKYILQRVPAARVCVTPQGADLPQLDSSDCSTCLLDEFPELRGKQILLYMGRVTPKKRLELLVDALALLRSECPNLVLLVAGNNDGHLQSVENRVKSHDLQDRVVFAGFLQGRLKRGAFACAKLFALPSIDENFSVAVVEAMAHGVPTLVTPEVGSHTHVDNSGGGLTVGGNAPAIAEGTRKILQANHDEMARKARGYVADNLTWPRIYEKVDHMYHRSLESQLPIL